MKKHFILIAVLTLTAIFVLLGCAVQPSGDNEETDEPSATVTATPLPTAIKKATPSPTPVRDQNTEVPAAQEFTIPKAATAPVIDGVKSEGEWDNALVITLNNKNTWDPLYGVLECQGGTFYEMWDEDGLYLYAEINDADRAVNLPNGNSGSYNSADGVQLCIYADSTCVGGNVKKLFFFSLCPKANDGNAYIGEHFVLGDGSNGANVPDGVIKAVDTETGYIIECKIGKATLLKSTPSIKLAEGTQFKMANIILDADKNYNQSIFCDTAWFNAPASSNYTLGK